MASRGKRTFWVTAAPTNAHKERAELLGQNGFDVVVLKGVPEVIEAINESRPICIIVDSTSNLAIQKMAQIPELNGVRFILSVIDPSSEAMKEAAAENYRDMIPIKLPPARWLQRMQYATATKSTEFPHPLCEISMNQIAVAFVPARIVWVSETHMRLECRGRQNLGNTIQITGAIAKAFGVPYISLTVESIHREHLLYRFSQALVCRWRISENNSEKAAMTIRRMSTENPFLRFRAFVTVSNPELRKTLVKELNRDRFEVKVALQRSTLMDELSYFSPDVLFLDEKILASMEEVDILLMLSKIPVTTPIVLYGHQIDESEMRRVFGTKTIYFEKSVNLQNLANAVHYYKLTPQNDNTETTGKITQILQGHAWSKIELQAPARLTSLNPMVGKISLPYSLGAYASARLEAPILRKALGRDPYIKITETHETTADNHAGQFLHHGKFYLADVDPAEQIRLSEVLMSMMTVYYQNQFIKETQVNTALNSETSDISNVTAVQGTLALKESYPAASSRQESSIPSMANASPAQSSTRADKITVVKKAVKLQTSFSWRRYIDVTILKAIVLFLVAMAITGALLNAAMNIDQSFYEDHGRQYSDFFRRMSDPKFRNKNPEPPQP